MAIKKLSQFYRQTFVIPLLCIFACASALAQSQSKQSLSHIEILKLKWEKQARLPRNFDPSVIPTGTVFSTMESRTGIPGSTQTPFGDEARQEAARRSAALGPVDIFPNAPARMPVFNVYSMKIRNDGEKTISAIAWDYVFIHATTKAVVGNHQLQSYLVVKPGRVVTLQSAQRARPIAVVQAGKPDAKGQGPKYLERAVIQCVLYADETTWKNPVERDESCDLLKKNKPSQTRKADANRAKVKSVQP
jgi:hypothetical protein